MHTKKIPSLITVATAVVVATLVTCAGLAPATAAPATGSTATPAPAATAGATATPAPATSPASTAAPAATAGPAAPTPTPTPAPSSGTSPVTGANPDLATQNKARNHAMGSTIPQNQPGSKTASPNVTASPSAVPPGLPGLDVSGWQTGINWSQVAANGAKFVYIKATESTDYVSSQFASQYSGSYAAGLTRGAYHFATPDTSSGATQANYFVDNGGGWSQDGRTLPPLLDIEYNPYGATCYGLSAQAMVNWIADFSNTVFKRTSRYPAIYSTTGWWTQCTGNSAAFGINPLFIARYPNSISDGPGTLPAGWGAYTMWQWADSGIFPGDQDVFNGSAAALQQLAITGRAMAQPIIGAGDLNGDGKPDLLARKPDGSVWFYAGTGASGSSAGYLNGVQIMSGFGIYDQIIVAGDLNGDGKPDLLARKTDGTLVFFPGTGVIDATHSGFGPAVVLGQGWDIYTDLIAAGDVTGDHKPDLLARRPDGSLWLYAGTGAVSGSNVGFANGVQIGVSWNIFSQVLGAGDLDGDGFNDLLGFRPDGSLWLYKGSASGFGTGTQVTIPGLSASDLLISSGDANGDGKPDLLSRTSSGTLNFFAGTARGQAAYGGAQIVGSGWQAFTSVIGSGDLNGDAKPDVVAIRNDGTLWCYPGRGTTGGMNSGYSAGVLIGSGWGSFTRVVDGGDVDGNGTRDLIAVRNDGSLWLYPSTGSVSTGSGAYSAGIQIGSGWGVFTQVIAGDYNGDGVQDLLATRADGSLWFYPGIRHTSSSTAWFGQGVQVGNGWNGFTFASSGDANGDGKADLVAKRSDGTLWFYAGTGSTSSGGIGWGGAALLGGGWNTFTSVTGTGDRSPGRSGDLIGVRNDGALVYYPNTIIPIPGYASAVTAGSGWSMFG
ncbi:GH25 family lysozyme [Microbacterium sp. X-17]|uniref:GH25 family lysozyme n=1 Tax=Microbacterium sp. X-17 TaxID=3144404 RepID=UPI0031F55945